MKRVLVIVFVAVLTNVLSVAQLSWPTMSGSTATSAGPARFNDDQDSFIVTGKIVVADGIPLPEAAAIELSCKGDIRIIGYSDDKGSFDLRLNLASSFSRRETGQFLASSMTLYGCELEAKLPNFVSEKVHLSKAVEFGGMLRVGTVVVHYANREPGVTISATIAAAPSKAQKAFQKGREQATRSNWNGAADHFREAVRIYPKYASAWVYLGKVEVHQGELDAARESFQEALKADQKFVDAYAELARLALRAKQWQELADDTDHILQINPAGMPQFWYLNSAANFELRKIDTAEKSALQGLRIDAGQRVPQLQFLLGVILAVKHDYRGAAEHIRHYVHLAPHAKDAAVAEKQLLEVERLSGVAE
jgi:tetratricopeptide (TPR) repeat protein